MPQPEFDALARQVRELQERVACLERFVGVAAQSHVSEPQPKPSAGAPILPETTTLLPILGRALLGLAGAYLLRALTESGTLAPRTGIAIGLLYAMLWLVLAARSHAGQKLETALHSLTSVLVLLPLLWEATLRFHAVSTWAAGAILLAFTLFGLAVSWKKDHLIVATIVILAGLGVSAALLVATHDAIPFAFVFLAIAAAVEASACLNHWLSERWLAATAADLAVLLATWLVTNERGVPEAWAPITHPALLAVQVALLAVYLGSTGFRTLFRGTTFTGFETAQCALAFAISVGGGLRLSSEDPYIAPAMAVLALVCAAACYGIGFLLLDRGGPHGRNFYTYSTFAILLTVAGSRILLSGIAAAAVWSLLAIAGLWGGSFFGRLTLQVHGAIYLLLGLVSSGALAQTAGYLLGNASMAHDGQVALWTGILAAAICYRVGARSKVAGLPLRLVLAGTLVWLSAGIAGGALTAAYLWLFGDLASHAYCATLRTAVLAAAALLLAWAGARWDKLELSRLIYPAMLLGAYRLIAVDLHGDRNPALFLSLLLYGSALITLPKIRVPKADLGLNAQNVQNAR
jgi:hypothetical protein